MPCKKQKKKLDKYFVNTVCEIGWVELRGLSCNRFFFLFPVAFKNELQQTTDGKGFFVPKSPSRVRKDMISLLR